MSGRYGRHNGDTTEDDCLKNKENLAMTDGEKLNQGSKPPRKETKKKTCLNYFKEFTSSTSLHGLQYIGEDGRPMTERVWWVVMFTLSLTACVYLILQIWNKWQNTPVIVNFAESSTPIWQVAFPAVSICAQTKSLQSIFNYTDVFHRRSQGKFVTEAEIKYFDAIALLCNYHTINFDGNWKNFTDRTTLDMMSEVGYELDDMIQSCQWKSKPFRCGDYFHKIITENGVCYTFNIMDAKEMLNKEMLHEDYPFVEHGNLSTGWNLHEGYSPNQPFETYPRRGPGFGATDGLTILLESHIDDLDYVCQGPYQGFKVSLHTPTEIPRVLQNFVLVPHGQNVQMSVKPNMISTSETLVDYDPEKRVCFYPYERKLKYFSHYTKDNCLLECVTNYTARVCGCVSFYMPRDSQTPICAFGKDECVRGVEEEMLMNDIRKEMKLKKGYIYTEEESLATEAGDKLSNECNCSPGCTSMAYDVETSQSEFAWKEFLAAMLMSDQSSSLDMHGPYLIQKNNYCKKNNLTCTVASLRDGNKVQISSVSIFFKESEFTMSIRSELYGRFDFLANCGGLLGLCLGFSVLSLIEIIYFLTLRACCNLHKRFSRKTRTKETDGTTNDFD